MKLSNPLRRLAATAGLLVLGTGHLWAVGFRLPNQDPMGIARGNAFVATADNPSAIYYNPAGITQLEGHQLSAGLYFITTNVDFESLTGVNAETDETFQAVPQIHYVYSPEGSPWSFGLGIYAPYGLGIDYGNNTPFNTVAENAKLLYASFNPVVAYQVNDQLSLAFGLTLNYSEVNFERSIGLAPGDEFKFEGDGHATGFNAGLLWQPHEQWSFGINYRSHTEVSYSGDSKATPLAGWTSTNAAIDYPQFVDVGVSYRPNSDWNFEVNVDWTDWDTVNTSTFVGTFAGNVPFPFQYDSSFMYEFGVTRYFDNGWWASAGYIFSENSVPDSTFSPLNPDSDLHLGSVGVGHRGEDWSWAVGYHFAYNDGRDVRGNIPNALTGQSANGEFKTFNQAVNISVRRSF